MKKFKISLIAVVALVMGIAGSAFMNGSNAIPASQDPATYWFLMDASGTHVTTTQVSDPSTLCKGTLIPDCAREYDASQTEIVGGVRRVKASQVNAQIDFLSKEEM